MSLGAFWQNTVDMYRPGLYIGLYVNNNQKSYSIVGYNMYIYFATQAACKRNTDVKKAFDSHSKLLIKLPAYGLSDNLLVWLAEFLRNRSQIVKLNSCYSHTLHVSPTASAFSVATLMH